MTHLPNELWQKMAAIKEKISEDQIWLATTFSLSRNLSIFKFLPCLTPDKKLEVLNAVQQCFAQLDIENFYFVMLKDLSLWQKEFLFEHFLFPYHSIDNSEGEAFIIHDSGEILVAVNLQDHLILHAIDLYGNPEKILKRLVQLDCQLHTCLSFAFSSDFGFLTTNPLVCGTALKAQCFLHLPALLQSQKELEWMDKECEVSFSGLLPEVEGFPGNILVLSNTYTLGLTEEQILSTLQIWVSKLIVAEKFARKQSKADSSDDLKNHILRSLGVLTHSYCLDLDEALNTLSWLQLGLNLQYVFCKEQSLHRSFVPLFWLVRRGHLAWMHQPEEQKNLEREMITQLRANVLKTFAEALETQNL